MLRLTELRLPLEHSADELRAAVLAGARHRGAGAGRLFDRPAQLRRQEAGGDRPHLSARRRDDPRARGPRAAARRPPRRPRPPDTSYRFPVQAPEAPASRPLVIGVGPCGLFAALLLAEIGFRPLVLERGKEVRQRTVDTFGLWRRRTLDPESNVQFGEGGAGTFSDGKLYSQIKDPGHRGRKVLAELVEAGAPPEILFVHRPHIGTFRLVKIVESHAGEDRVPGRRDPLSEPGRGPARRGREGARGDPRRRRAPGGGPRDPGGRPQRPGHLPHAPRPRRPHRGQALLHRLSHRAPPVAHRPLPLRAAGRQPAPRRRRLQAGPPLPQRPLGLQLLHVPGRHRGGGGVRARAGGHQRHEPVLPRRAQRQQRHRRRHHAGGLSRRPLGRRRLSAPVGGAGVRAGRRRLRRAGPARRRLPRRPALHGLRLGPALVPARRASGGPAPVPAGLRDRGDPRGAARLRPQDQGVRHGRRPADRRRDADLLADPHPARRRSCRASARKASTPPAREPATPAASSPPPSTASGWRRPSPGAW